MNRLWHHHGSPQFFGITEDEGLMELERQLNDYRLTTAQIFYHMPDHPGLLQEFIWQQLDLAPKFPVLTKFLKFWHDNLDGKLHSVRVAHAELISPAELNMADVKLTLH